MHQYKRAPITEAIIELRIEPKLERSILDKVQSRLAKHYPFSEMVVEGRVNFDIAQRQAKFEEEDTGYKLASLDQADVVVVSPVRFSCSRLAPYVGWDAFSARAKAHWKVWVGSAGYHKIRRIGVRYINRIDIPLPPNGKIIVQEYLNVNPQIPDFVFPELSNYTMQLLGPMHVDDCNLIVNSGIVPSPLVGRASVLFDVDISREANVPQSDDEVWSLIDRIREHKNRIFEACITDKARELFDS